MARKVSVQVLVLVMLLLACFGIPVNAHAGGVCGGTYVADPGDTVDKLAAKCGTSAAAIYTANPGISGTLSTGQVLTIPGISYNVSSTPIPVTTSVGVVNNYNTYNYYNYNPATSYSGIYTVQYGDTFSGIAVRYGVTINDLWAANPSIWNINLLFVGQMIHIPASAGQLIYSSTYPYTVTIVPTPTEAPLPLSYGTVPSGTAYGSIKLSNKANAEVYVSLQATTRDGSSVINEYPVSGSMNVRVPAGWYVYVAWVGGQKFEGQFKLGGESDHTMTFYSNKVVVE